MDFEKAPVKVQNRGNEAKPCRYPLSFYHKFWFNRLASLYSSKGKGGTESKIDTCSVQAQTSGKPIRRPIQTDGKEMGGDGTQKARGNTENEGLGAPGKST